MDLYRTALLLHIAALEEAIGTATQHLADEYNMELDQWETCTVELLDEMEHVLVHSAALRASVTEKIQ